jgi:hypothetical protein
MRLGVKPPMNAGLSTTFFYARHAPDWSVDVRLFFGLLHLYNRQNFLGVKIMPAGKHAAGHAGGQNDWL